jgi:CheY-like chemotaxis protein
VPRRDEVGFLVRTFNEMLGRIEQREIELEQARDAALDNARLKSAFLASISHEIRTPVNIVIGYAELLESLVTERGEEIADTFETMRRGAGRLIDTIDKVLDISKIETGAFETHRAPIRVAAVIERCLGELRVLAEQKGITLSGQVDEPDATLEFDPYCLSQAIINLVANAIKFTEHGGVFVRLARGDDGGLALSVSDTGIGMDAGYLSRLFEPFSQEDPSMTRRFEGSGLGLALVRSYARMNGADVEATSRKGQGSTFTLRFPREIEVAAPAPAPDRATAEVMVATAPRNGHTGSTPTDPVRAPALTPVDLPAPPATSAGDGQRGGAGASAQRPVGILVVEDDGDTLAYMRRLLGDRYEVFLAPTAADARQQLRIHGDAIGLLLMDLSLKGGEDGLSLTRSLRQDARWARVPIVATTAHAFPEDRTRALRDGCTDFIAKPIHRTSLLGVVERHLNGSGASAGASA